MKNWKKFSKDTSVYFPKKIDKFLSLSKKKTEFIKKSKNLVNLKSRICSHVSNNDKIHEMFIFHKKSAYVRPHRHVNKLESFHLISGKATIIFFDNNGKPKKIIKMGDYKSGKTFYYKIFKSFFHTVLIEKDVLFHEVTSGPFVKNKTIYAKWSPDEKNYEEVKKYLLKLKRIAKLA
tara:strand:+ start:888 stop:1418 length:531 start_codon:yes stop_codon:yes gene_type:complete